MPVSQLPGEILFLRPTLLFILSVTASMGGVFEDVKAGNMGDRTEVKQKASLLFWLLENAETK